MDWRLSVDCGGLTRPLQTQSEVVASHEDYHFRTLPTTNMYGQGPARGKVTRGAQTIRLHHLREVYVGRCGVIYDAHGRIFLPHLAPFIGPGNHDLSRFGYVFGRYGIRPGSTGAMTMGGEPFEATDALDGPVFLASSYWDQAYTHFFLELMPSILHYRTHLRSEMPLLVMDRVAEARAGLLDLMGLRDRVVSKPAAETTFVEDLRVLDYPRFCGPEVATALEETFGGLFSERERGMDPPIYLARHDDFQWDRMLLNEDEVVAALARRGVETYVPSRHDTRAQLRKLWRARCVVGLYGGAMFNLVLGMRGKRSVMLASENYNRFDVDGLIQRMGHRSEKVLCRSFESRADKNNSPIFADPQVVVDVFDRVMG